jgi:alpha-L-fucosidase 2
MKRIINIIALLLLYISCSAAAKIDLSSIPAKGFKSMVPASDWTKSLLSGNGIMGAMVMGYPYSDTIIVNHALLYRPQTAPRKPVSQGAHLDEIRKLMLEGDYQGAADYIVKLSKSEGYSSKIWTDPFIPAFDILINQKKRGNKIIHYSRTLDFESGVSDVKWSDGNAKYSRQTFVSRKDNLVITKITSDRKGHINCSIALRERVNPEWWAGIDARPSKETHDVRISVRNGCLIYSSVFDNQIPHMIKSYQGVTRVINRGGKLVCRDNKVFVYGADQVVLLTRVAPDYNDTTPDSNVLIGKLRRYTADFDLLLQAHKKLHGALFDRVSINLGGDNEHCTLSSEDLINKSKGGEYNPTLVEKEFYAARYHLISATGINPPNLQGIWGGTTTPPWSGDYTTNGNLPVAISSYLSANLPELMLPVFNMMERYDKDFETNAKVLFNAHGIHVPSRLSTHGLNNHFDETWPMTFWTAGAAWYAMYYYDYYLYTGDKNFLRTRALPFMEKAAAFYEDFLIKGENGKYMFVPSYSPENNPANNPSQACINATMDVMAANQLLHNCIEASSALDVNKDKIETWRKMLNDMPPYELNEKGELREWMWPGIQENHSHRHVSHLYGLFDRMDPIIKNNSELREGCRKVINERMKIRRQDSGGVMVFGLTQLGCAASNLNESETSFDILKWLSGKYWNTNFFTFHDPGTLFNCDLSGGFQQFIIKMLVYSEPREISLLPALPKEIPHGNISGLLLRGNVHLDNLKWDNNSVNVRLTSKENQSVKIILQKDAKSYHCDKATRMERISNRQFSVQLNNNKSQEISFTF